MGGYPRAEEVCGVEKSVSEKRITLKFRDTLPTIGKNQRYVAEKIVNGSSTPKFNAPRHFQKVAGRFCFRGISK